MSEATRILYCHCAYARVVPQDVKNEVLVRLADSGRAFETVPDLCEMSARSDPALKQLASDGPVKIAACYARAVKWLFSAAGAPLPEQGIEILNMRVESAAQVATAILDDVSKESA